MKSTFLDTIVWSVSLGASFLKSSHVNSEGRLAAAMPLPAHDIVAFVPRSACFNSGSLGRYAHATGLLRPSPRHHRYSEAGLRQTEDDEPEMSEWFPGVTRSQFEHAALMALISWNHRQPQPVPFPSLDGGEAAHLAMLSDDFQQAVAEVEEREEQKSSAVADNSRDDEELPWSLRDAAVEAISTPDFDSLLRTSFSQKVQDQILMSLEKSSNSSSSSRNPPLLTASPDFRREFLRAFLALELRTIGPDRSLVPLLDMCLHEADANCRVGMVKETDEEVIQYMLDKGLRPPQNAPLEGFLMQTTREVPPDHVLTLNRAELLQLEEAEFPHYFGFQF